MASSGDYTFNPNTYAIITGAMRLIGAIQTGETPPAEEYEDALSALNGVIHAFQAAGMHVWTQTEIDLTLVSGQRSYQIGIGSPDLPTVPRPLKVTEGRYVVVTGGAVVPLIPMSRWDYANLSNKTNLPGPPTQYFYDPQLPYGIMNIYPAPDAAYTVQFVAQRPLQSFDTQRDTADLPQEWISALRFALAVELAPEYDVPQERFQLIKLMLDEKVKSATMWDTEPTGTATLPFSQAVYQIIAGALRLCGGCGPQEVPVLGLVNNGFYSLNSMIQAWQASGIHVWTESDAILLLQPGQSRYLLGAGSTDKAFFSADWTDSMLSTGVYPTTSLPRPLRVPAARRYRFATSPATPIETPMGVLSRIDYAALPNKSVQGVPTSYFFDPQLNLAVMNVWPTPSDTSEAVKFTVQMPLQTYGSLSAVTAFPAEWNSALRYCLAMELWPEHAERRVGVKGDFNVQHMQLMADEKLNTARAWDREPESIYFGLQSYPDWRN